MHDTRKGLFRKDYTNKHMSKLFLNKVGSELYYTALEKEKNRLLKIWGKKLNLLKMANKDKNKKRETHYSFSEHYLAPTTVCCWEHKDERDFLPASRFLREKYYTNKVRDKMLSLKVTTQKT